MLHVLARNWWALLIRGIAAVVFGILAFVWPGATWVAIGILFGAYAFVDGIFAIVAAVRMASVHGRWGGLLLEGILGVLAGVAAFCYPGLTALVLAVIMGAWAIVTGILAVSSAWRLRAQIPNEWLWVLSGIVSVLFGIAIFWSPAFGLFALVWMVAFYAILAGLLMIGLAFRLRGMSRQVGAAA